MMKVSPQVYGWMRWNLLMNKSADMQDSGGRVLFYCYETGSHVIFCDILYIYYNVDQTHPLKQGA